MIKVVLADAAATRALGCSIGFAVVDGAVIALEGTLGAGKTTLVKGVGEGLGVKETVASPTFTMLNEYHSGRLAMYHVDLYRLKDDPVTEAALGGPGLELFRAELDEVVESGPSVLLVEWADVASHVLPSDRISIALEYVRLDEPDAGRTAVFSATGPTSEELLERLQLL